MSEKDLKGVGLLALVDMYESETGVDVAAKEQILLLILTHEEMKASLKNQAAVIKRIFTYEHLSLLIEYLKQEKPADASLLNSLKYDPSGQNIPLCLKLPFMAMEILCCECQLINELLFVGSTQHPEPLLPKLLQFLDHPQHYHLASYFSKVICAITKRVTSPTHKYNPIFTSWVLGDNDQQLSAQCSLYKSIKHLYSPSTIQFITKWLLLSRKEIQKVQIDEQIVQKCIINFKKPLKLSFLQNLLEIVNANKLDVQIMNNIPILFEQMLSSENKAKSLPSLSFKSLGPTNQAPKITLYDLSVEQTIISEVFKVPDEGCLSISKILLIRMYLNRYMLEYARFHNQKQQQQQSQSSNRLLQAVNSDNLYYLFQWIVQHIKTLLNLTKKQISSEASPHLQNQPIEESRITLTPPEKMLILQLCQLLRILQSLQCCRFQIVQYFNEHCIVLVNVIKRLMNIDNNLIHLQASKIVLQMIRSRGKDKTESVPYDFARKLLQHALLQLIQIHSIKSHVVQWADILLSIDPEHIFQDYEEEFQWEYIREIVEQAKQLHIGQYRSIQTNIDCFYSEEKALNKYSHFLHDFKAIVIYEDKKQSKTNTSDREITQSTQKVSLSTSIDSQKSQVQRELITKEQTVEDGETSEANLFFLGGYKGNYLAFNVNDLIEQL